MTTITTPPTGDMPLYLGSSFQQSQRDPSYWSLRYDFKPASHNSEAPGTLRMGADNQVQYSKHAASDNGLWHFMHIGPVDAGIVRLAE